MSTDRPQGEMSQGFEAPAATDPDRPISIQGILRLPLKGPRLVFRALDDLHTVAENARRQPDAVQEITALLQALLTEVAAVTVIAGEVAAQAREIVSGGAELNQTGRTLDMHAAQIVDGGRDLVEVARSLDETLTVFRQHLPKVLSSLDTVEDLEQAAETMAETMEPLQGAAERVGRFTKRLGR